MRLCECGCGLAAPIAKRTRTHRGETIGTPLRFVKGHHLRLCVKPQSTVNYPVKLLADGRVVKAHRLRAERALGRPLPPAAEVHHVDGSKNPLSPLVICPDSAYHHLLHVRQRVLRAGGDPNTQRICAACKRLLPFVAFNKRRATINSGLGAQCRKCQSDYDRKRYQRQASA